MKVNNIVVTDAGVWYISFYNGATWCNSVVVVPRFDSVIGR